MMDLPEGLRFLALDREKLARIWEELRELDWYLGGGSFADPVKFTELFFAKDSVILETDYGYMILEKIRPGESALAHLPFTDHRLSVHTEDVKAALLWAFIEYDLRRIEARVYWFQRAVKRFLRKLGFTFEGCLRKKALRRGKFEDIEVYSILREEVIDGIWK